MKKNDKNVKRRPAVKWALKTVLFLYLGALMLLCVQDALKEKFLNVNLMEPGVMLKEFYELPEDEIQTAVLGASSVGFAIDPMMIYMDTGITLFNMSTGGQPVEVSRYLCEELFKTQQPKVVLMDVSSVFLNSFWSGGYRSVLDCVPLSREKLELASVFATKYAENTRGSSWQEAYLSVLFPITQYHTRWTAAKESMFVSGPNKNEYRKGHRISSTIIGSVISMEQMDELAEQDYYTVDMTGGAPGVSVHEDLYKLAFNEENWQAMLQIKQFCEEKGAAFLLIKAPSFGPPLTYDGAWTAQRSKTIKERAAQAGIDFIDFQYDVDLGMDWKADPAAGIQHLNYHGARKLTKYVEKLLQEKYRLTGTVSEVYMHDIPAYIDVGRLCDLALSSTLDEYVEQLQRWEDITLLIAVSDEATSGLTDEICETLKSLGIQTNFRDVGYNDAYLAVVESGKVSYEAYANHPLAHSGVLVSGARYSLESRGYMHNSLSKIVLNGVDYSINRRGLNIAVVDNISGIVIDSVQFDLFSKSTATTAIHDNTKKENALNAYQNYLMIRDAQDGDGA